MKLFPLRNKATTISITNETIVRAILIGVAAVIGLRMLNSLSHVLTLIGVSFFLAIALNPAVKRISDAMSIKSRALATGLAYILVLSLLIIFAALVVPPLIQQITDFLRSIPTTINDFQNSDSDLARAVYRYGLDEQLSNFANELGSKVGNVSGPLLSTAGRIGGTIISIVTVLVLTFMMLVEGPLWLERIWAMQPGGPEKDRRKKVFLRMYRVVTSYVNGQVLIAAIAASFSAIAMLIGSTIADVSINSIALAGIVFLFGLIPMIGNTLAAVIVVLFCLIASPGLAIGMAIYFLLYQQIENATLQPYIQAKSNDLTPLIVFVAALLGASLGGLLGALAAIPAAGCLRVIFDEYIAVKLPTPETIEKAKTDSAKKA